jgi:hypothetical protein
MHNHLVAQGYFDPYTTLRSLKPWIFRDLITQNIMMDARPILPNGWHFVADGFAPNRVDLISLLARIDHPVLYYIIDFPLKTSTRKVSLIG